PRYREGAAIGDRERLAEGRLRRRCRSAVRQRVLRESGAVTKTDSSGPDGPRVPDHQTHGASDRSRDRAPDGRRAAGGAGVRDAADSGRGHAQAAARRQAEGQARGEACEGRRGEEKDGRRAQEGSREGWAYEEGREELTAVSRQLTENYGSESTSARVPTRVQQDVALAWVRGQGRLEAASRRSEATRHAQGAIRARRRVEDRDRARR